MSTENNTPQPADEASQWYADLRANSIRNIDARLEELASGHSALENTWNELNQRQEDGLASDDMRTVLETERERARLQQEAQQIQQGYGALQAERQRLEQHAGPRFEELIANSSAPAQMFLRVHRHKLENDPAALKQLMFADARAKAVGIKPDTPQFFNILETAANLDASDRSLDDFSELSDEMRSAKHSARREPKPQAPVELTPEQEGLAKDLGVSSEDYAKHIQQPFSQAHSATTEFDSGKPMEVKLDEDAPAKKTAPQNYKPGPNAVTLSPAQVRFCNDSGIDPKDYVRNKLAVDSGKSAHQWYEQRLKSQGLA